MRAFITDFRNNWDNSYWWLDHQTLRMSLIGIVSGLVGLLFLRLRLGMVAKYGR